MYEENNFTALKKVPLSWSPCRHGERVQTPHQCLWANQRLCDGACGISFSIMHKITIIHSDSSYGSYVGVNVCLMKWANAIFDLIDFISLARTTAFFIWNILLSIDDLSSPRGLQYWPGALFPYRLRQKCFGVSIKMHPRTSSLGQELRISLRNLCHFVL